jgi:hypothetical protein
VRLTTASAAGDNRPVSTIERPLPPLNADERTTLEGWLDFHRATLVMKCEGLGDEQAATLRDALATWRDGIGWAERPW